MSSRWNFGPYRRKLTRRLIETATEHYKEYGDPSSIAVVGGGVITSHEIIMGKNRVT